MQLRHEKSRKSCVAKKMWGHKQNILKGDETKEDVRL